MKWWGYVHTNGSLHAKRWFDEPADLSEASQSPFVAVVIPPFEAENREAALKKIEEYAS